ncbi:restriction endonuclease subunit S [Bilophila wadsworthia]|uniref:restriction endonuclease subunit S n=1 Tax=Bilophila wadsworthia TaxID=35833 RepID=UPI00243326A0|nr:restriction endonuclease subunit S [Bilophila wadsworthia]
MRPKEYVLPSYLFNFCKSDLFINEISQQATGASYPAVTSRIIKNCQIPLPSLSEQKRIADILDKATELIALRKQQLEKLDLLVKSRFIEMFGTFPLNEKKWKTGNIREVISEARYGSSRPAVDGGRYPYLRMNNITYSGELDLTDIKYIDIPDNELVRCAVSRGDVLFNRTNSKELVGKTCVYDRDEMMI